VIADSCSEPLKRIQEQSYVVKLKCLQVENQQGQLFVHRHTTLLTNI